MEMILRFVSIFRTVSSLPEKTVREPVQGDTDSFDDSKSLKSKSLEYRAFRFRDKKTQGMGGSERLLNKFIRRYDPTKCVIPSFGILLQ